MKKVTYLSALFVFGLFSNFLWANTEEDYLNMKKNYDTFRKKYWNFKADIIRQKKGMKEELNLLDQELKNLYLQKNNLQEEVFLLKDNNEKLKEKLAEEESIEIDLITKVEEIVESDKKKAKSLYPHYLNTSINSLNLINNNIKQKKIKLAITKYFEYRKYLIDEGSRFEVGERSILNPEKGERLSAKYARLGFIHQSFTSPNAEGFMIRQTDLGGVSYKWYVNLSDNVKNEIKNSVLKIYNKPDQKLIYLPLDVNQNGKKLKSISDKESGNIFVAFLTFFKSGGLLMYFLFADALLALYFGIERLIFYQKGRKGLKESLTTLDQYIKEDALPKAKEFCQSINNPVTRILLPALNVSNPNRFIVEKTIEESMANEIPQLEKRLNTLSVLGAIAPLLGLLGTVSGMIALFEVITTYGTNDPKILAGGISIALVTTQVGLAVAIPIMLGHHYLVIQKNKLINSIESNINAYLNRFFPKS